MRVRLLVACHGRCVGDEIDVPEDEAVRLFSGRWAVPVAPPLERAVKIVPETRGPAVNSGGGRSGGKKKSKA